MEDIFVILASESKVSSERQAEGLDSGADAYIILPVSNKEFLARVHAGELSLGKDFDGLLPWGSVDNRPFLRCLFGYGLCLWRFGRLRDAEKVFTRILWLNPTDNQGARFNLSDVKKGNAWHE